MKRRKTEPFIVRGYRYISYEECARKHNCSAETVRQHVLSGRNDELPPRHVDGRSEYLDQMKRDREARRKEQNKRNYQRYKQRQRE